MRLGVELPGGVSDWREVCRTAARTDELGIDLLYLRGATADSLQLAASLSTMTRYVLFAAEVEVTSSVHPIHLAERAAVTDQLLSGRLILVLRSDDEALLAETVEVVAKATMSRPFTHVGGRWSFAGADGEALGLRVTPAPVQPVLPIWVCGAAAPAVAAEVGLSVVGLDDADTASLCGMWKDVERSLGVKVQLRLNRPGIRPLVVSEDRKVDVPETVQSLLRDRDGWQMDIAVMTACGGRWLDSWTLSLATQVRPRVQLSVLPDGIEEFWDLTVQDSMDGEFPAPYGRPWKEREW